VADQVVAENRGSFTLGAEATSPLALANAYATLAASGTQCAPTPVTEILDRDGRPLAGPDGTPVPVGSTCTPGAVRPDVATTLNQILVGDTALPFGTGTRAAIPGHQIAGKTGTSQDRFSVAFVGYTPQYSASVMILNPKRNEDIGGYGGRLAAPIWRGAMLPVLSAQEPAVFAPPGIPLRDPTPPPPRRPAPTRTAPPPPRSEPPPPPSEPPPPPEATPSESPPPEESSPDPEPAGRRPAEESPAEESSSQESDSGD
jgi:membrane peptidoglycan carboxypeptidase